MTLRVRDVDPDAMGRVRCKCCDKVMPLADVLISGDSLVCPICGEYESFITENFEDNMCHAKDYFGEEGSIE